MTKKNLFHVVWMVPAFLPIAELAYLTHIFNERHFIVVIWEDSPLYLLAIAVGFILAVNTYHFVFVGPYLRGWYRKMGLNTDAWDLF